MKPRFLLPAFAAIAAAGSAMLTLQAQDNAPQKQFRFEFRDDGSGKPRLFRDGKEIKPKEGVDPLQQMQEDLQKEMQDHLKRMMGGGGDGSGPNLDELFKQMRERGGQPAPQSPGQGGGNMQDLFKKLGASQGAVGESSRYSKHHRSALSEWRPLVKDARESTVRIMRDNKQVAFGTIVSADGYALTKASEVEKGELEAEFHDGRIVKAKVVDKLGSYDLALVKLEATGLTPAKFAEHDATVSTLVAAVGVDEDPVATGVISVAARSLDEKGKGALGISFDPNADEAGRGVSVGEIVEGCAAEKAGLKKGDIILSVNGTDVDFPGQLQKLVSSMKPGDKVKVKYTREKQDAELEFALSSREELLEVRRRKLKEQGVDVKEDRSLDPTARMGSVLSGQASGYPKAVQSDFVIDANDCGGPVVDVDGHVVAINIARAERVSTFMIPGKVIRELLSDVQTGKFTLSKDADTLKSELRDYEAAIKKAQDAMKEAETKRAEAEAALQKLGK